MSEMDMESRTGYQILSKLVFLMPFKVVPVALDVGASWSSIDIRRSELLVNFMSVVYWGHFRLQDLTWSIVIWSTASRVPAFIVSLSILGSASNLKIFVLNMYSCVYLSQQ